MEGGRDRETERGSGVGVGQTDRNGHVNGENNREEGRKEKYYCSDTSRCQSSVTVVVVGRSKLVT